MPDAIIKCLQDNLDKKGYGVRRIGEITERYTRYKNIQLAAGKGEAEAARIAEQTTLIEMQYTVQAKAHMLRSNQGKLVDIKTRVRDASNPKDIREAGISLWEDNPKFAGKNVATLTRSYLGKYWALMGNVLDDFSKGAFGRQLGKAHFDDVVRELFGGTTRSKPAKEIAAAYKRLQKVMLADFNKAGGVMRELVDFNLPQGQSAVRMIKGGKETWVQAHMNWLDWSKTRWPDGSPILPTERQGVLESVFDTLSTNGKIKIEPKIGGGQGASMGNALDKHRFLVYKDADSWLAMHKAFADGSVYDVITRHIESMAHKNAMVDVWGSNPEAMVNAAKQTMQQHAANLQRSGVIRSASDLSMDRFNVMSDNNLRLNVMDQENWGATVITTTGNLATAAMLKAATLLAVGSDTVTTMGVRFAQGQGGYKDVITGYLKAMFPGGSRSQAKDLALAGFIQDELISNNFIAARFGAGHQYGKAWSNRAADFTMRASWMVRHTNAMRGANQLEMMGALHKFRNTAFKDTPFRQIMERAGITADEWDRVRTNVATWSPRKNVELIRPQDILDLKYASKDVLFQKFHSMILDESYRMVPSALGESQAILRGGRRPDSVSGAVLHSFGMFKSYPVSAYMMYTRLGASLESNTQRTKLAASLIVGSVFAGALGLQMRELAAGREMRDMDDPTFWIKAAASGGALSIYGDFITGAMAGDPGNIVGLVGGPLAGEMADAVSLIGGGAFQWAGLSDQVAPFEGSKFGNRLVEFLKRNVIPGTWQASLVLERDVYDKIQEWNDPAGKRKSNAARRSRQKRVYGNDYYLPPGQGVFTGP